MPGKPPTECKGLGGLPPLRLTEGESINVEPGAPGRRWEELTEDEQAAHQTIRLSDLSRLDVQPGDILVYRHSGPIPDRVADLLQGQWRDILPAGVKLAIIDNGAEIAVIRPAA